MSNEWYKKFQENLEKSKNDISKNDFRFYNISRLLLIAKKTLELKESCTTCASNIRLLEDFSNHLGKSMNTSTENRKIFDTQLNQIVAHLKKEHGISFAFYFTSLYTLIGLLTGIAAGTAIIFLAPSLSKEPVILISVVTGVVLGRIFGYLKDKKIFKDNKQI